MKRGIFLSTKKTKGTYQARLEGISPEARLEGISTQDVLDAINQEELARYLQRLPEEKLKLIRLNIGPNEP